MSEADIQTQIIEWARAHPEKIPCLFRVNCGLFRTFSGNIARGADKGTPDLIGYLPTGRMIALEVKSQKGRFSPEQTAWRKKATEAGVLVLAPRSLAALVAALE